MNASRSAPNAAPSVDGSDGQTSFVADYLRNNPSKRMQLIRAIIGAVCGYVIFALTGAALGVLSGRNLHAAQPLWFMVLTAGYGMLFAGLGGVVASRIAPHRGWAVVGTTSLVALGAAASLVTSPAGDARWSQWSAILLMAPSAYLAPRLLAPGRSKIVT